MADDLRHNGNEFGKDSTWPRIVLGFGTRPEAIKLAPVHHALREVLGRDPQVLVTGQHQEQLDQALRVFGIEATANLRVMTVRQQLPELAQRILPEAARQLRNMRADYVIVQGDTLSSFAIAWAAFLENIPVGHVEAGLRSHDLERPFPEEANRRMIGVLADLHFAPTALARENLLREGVASDRVLVTGQTGVDAILHAAEKGVVPADLPAGPFVTITLHRRENWAILEDLAGALAILAGRHRDRTFVFPVHLNPIVREAVLPPLENEPNVFLSDPFDFGSMAAVLARSELIITDSGGLQEEGTVLGVPVLVVRDVTERPEGIAAGLIRIAGTNPERLLFLAEDMLHGFAGRRRPSGVYGDGLAAHRVARAIAWRHGLTERPAEWSGPLAAEWADPIAAQGPTR